MAKIYKIEAYIVDVNEDFNDGEDLLDTMIDKTECYYPIPANYEEVEFEWDDDLVINSWNCTEADCAAYFEEG